MKRTIIILISFLSLSLACAMAGGKRWAVVDVSSCFLRAEPDYESPTESQCLMGTVVEITGEDRYWKRVDAPDYRACWVNELSLAVMDEAGKDAYVAAPKWICTAGYSHVYESASRGSRIICDFIMGDIIRKDGRTAGGWVGVELASGRKGWVPEGDVADFSAWTAERRPSGEALVDFAERLTGIPYMWGGNTIKHFDCSGLTKFVYMMNGIVLPRNAREQIHSGVGVPFDFALMKPGDLVFFGRMGSDGKPAAVTHVALYMGEGRIIHSSQLVRVNSLEDGRPDSYGRKPIAVRRILGHVDAGMGASSVAAAPWYHAAVR